MMGRTRGTLGAAITALAVALAGASAASSATPSPRATAEEPAVAVVEVATPALPTGRGESARQAWRRLRSHSAALLDRVADRNALAVESSIPETGQLSAALGDESVGELRRRLERDPRVLRVQADAPVEFRYVPNDFAFNAHDPNAPNDDFAQWNLRQSDGPAAWDLSKGAGAEVAVLDTGVYTAHPDLAGRIAATLDCTGGCGGTGISDGSGHGTHVAGLACADSDNSYGIASLGFDCSLFGVRIFTCSDAAAAIVAAANRGSDAISMSFGCEGFSSMADELDYAWSRGSVLVAAGDNEPNPPTSYPAQFVQPEGSGPDLGSGRGLVVTAAKYGGTRASFAQQTSGVSVAAFGAASDQVSGNQQGILSTFPPPSFPPLADDFGGVRTTVNGDNRFAYLVGTSMATPQVSGLVALMRAARPSIAAADVARLIKLTASHCGTYGNGIGWGVINAARAVAAADGRDIDPPRSKVRSARRGKLRIKRSDRPGKKPCSEALPSSGIKTVKIFASVNGGKYRKLGKTKRKVFPFRGKPGRRYRFFSRAIDKDGNREARPDDADAKLRVRR